MRARLQALPRTGVIVRVHHTRLYHASSVVQRTNLRNGEVIPNPFAPKPRSTARPIPNIYELVDRRATASSDDSGRSRQQQRFSKEDVSEWLRQKGEKSTRWTHSTNVTFPLDNVKDISNVSEFEELAARGEVGAPEAMLFLARSRMRLERLPLAEQRAAAAAVEAWRILSWVLQTDRRYWDTTLPTDFVRLLCWHLEAEQKGHVLMEWITTYLRSPEMQKDAIKAHNPFHRKHHVPWPTQVLARLVEAKVYWQEDRSVDSALECVLSALDRGLGRDDDIMFMGSPMIELETALLRDEVPPCSPVLFVQYCAWLPFVRDRDAIKPESGLARQMACMALYHPTNASAHPLAQFFRDESEIEFFLSRPDAPRQYMASDLLRASYLLRLEDDNSTARSLEDISQSLHPKPWSLLRKLYRRWKDDPKLAGHHSRSVHGKTLRPY